MILNSNAPPAATVSCERVISQECPVQSLSLRLDYRHQRIFLLAPLCENPVVSDPLPTEREHSLCHARG
jgi:hypothetical protein